jgi:hypothetical protein
MRYHPEERPAIAGKPACSGKVQGNNKEKYRSKESGVVVLMHSLFAMSDIIQ